MLGFNNFMASGCQMIMLNDYKFIDDLNLIVRIGPVSFNLIIDSSFLSHIDINNERHRHAAFEFHYITNGTGLMEIDGVQYDIDRDNFYLIRPGIYHMQKGSTLSPINKYCFKFEFEVSKNVEHNFQEDEIKNFVYTLSNIRFHCSKDIYGIKPIIIEIQSELKNKHIGYYTKTQFLFSQLLINIIRSIAMEGKLDLKEKNILPLGENRTKIIENYFDCHYNYNSSTQELCKQLHISRSQLNRILKDMYNMTFKQKQLETRLEYIKDLLVYTNIPLKTISEKSGFDSESNFSSFFKRELNMSPKQYRKQKKNGSI